MRRPLLLAAAALLALAAPATAAKPSQRLSLDSARVGIGSAHGSGVFGRWAPDGLGLPSYRYTLDHRTAPEAVQPEISNRREAWHQLGNDAIVANAYNRGYVQLWSQRRTYQWINYYDAAKRHYAGGYGYLRVGGRTISTLYDDAPAGSSPGRRFGTGYYERFTPAAPVRVKERVYAPFGDDPVLLHDVTLRNTSKAPVTATWFEYWDLNPQNPVLSIRTPLGLSRPVWNPHTRTLRVAQSDLKDSRPLDIYAAALDAPVAGFETSVEKFFGSGTRAEPEAARADRSANSFAPATGYGNASQALFAFRSPVTIAPGKAVTLRYAYGAAPRAEVDGLVAKRRAEHDAFRTTTRAWKAWLPQARFGRGRSWLSRELQWDAYTLRSGTTYEDGCGGGHIISQGGFYQYSLGFQGAYRDPLQHVLPMIYMAPAIARDVIRLSAAQQGRSNLAITPYATFGLCNRFDFGTSNDLDLWLLLTASEYGLATRDLPFFERAVRFSDGSRASLWKHLQQAFHRQEAQRGPMGGYITGATGDWSDFSSAFFPMTESMLVTAQAAYIYPRLAELADARGDRGFALELRRAAARLQRTLERQWSPRGWYARAYLGVLPIGRGAIFGEPQPWALLSGAPSRSQAIELVANIRRFLTGIGAPASVGGPTKIGSVNSPSAKDPEITERSLLATGVGSGNAVYVGGSWYAVNGWLTWALGNLDGVVPRAREYAFDEFTRNTLATHADAYPRHWNGVISVDDACRPFFDPEPERCGVGISTSYDGQIMHQPAWSLFDAIKLAGVEPTERGYRIDPHVPGRDFRLSLPGVGVAEKRGRLRGYVRAVSSDRLAMEVVVSARSLRSVRVYVGRKRVRATRAGSVVRFELPVRAGRAADWAVTYR
jgi:hypothetical protein